jgi:hypothetical protein
MLDYGVRQYGLVRRALLVPAFVFGATLVGGAAGEASARQVVTSFTAVEGGPGGGGGFRPPVTTRDLDRYAQVLGLNDEQKSTAKSMIEGVVTEFQGVAKEAREKMAEAEAEFQETRDPGVFRDRVPGAMRKMGEKRAELEKAFLGDLKLMLSPEQEANWGRFEMLRRRESNMGGGGMMGVAGEGVDLVKIGEKLGVIDGPLFGKATPSVKSLFEQYESELDKAIQDRMKAMADRPARREGEPMDMEAMQKAMAASREKGIVMRDINQKFARQIGAELGEPLTGKWQNEVKRAVFPEVYKETYADKALKTSMEMGDLTSEQRAVLAQVREQLDRELAPANDALAKAIAEADESGSRGGMSGGGEGGGPMMIRFGAEPETVKAARAAKREVENRAMEKVNGTLNESQRKKLPPRRTPRQAPEGHQDGDVQMEFVIEDGSGGAKSN